MDNEAWVQKNMWERLEILLHVIIHVVENVLDYILIKHFLKELINLNKNNYC